MSDHPLSVSVSEFYNELNVKLNFNTRVNSGDLTNRINDLIKQLSPETMKRYYGSGIVIPENIKGCRVLDIGCGSGSLVFILSKLVGPTGYVVGVDISSGLIDCCKQETEFHTKAWGYDKPNVEFHVGNAERLLDLKLGEFDMIVSNGVFCLVPDKQKAFNGVAQMLKPGGQFYLNDVVTQTNQPDSVKNDQKLFSLGTGGAMIWSDLKAFSAREGFTTPFLTQAAPVDIKNAEYRQQLSNAEYMCAAWRLFKLPAGASRGPATVTYLGNIEDYSDAFPWDFDLVFKKGEAVNVDADLATILSSTNFKNNFSFADFSGSVSNNRDQDPFQRYKDLQSQGNAPAPIYAVE